MGTQELSAESESEKTKETLDSPISISENVKVGRVVKRKKSKKPENKNALKQGNTTVGPAEKSESDEQEIEDHLIPVEDKDSEIDWPNETEVSASTIKVFDII